MNKIKLVVAVAALVGSFAAGRQSAQPQDKKTNTDVTQTTSDEERQIKERTRTVIVKRPDGTEVTTIDTTKKTKEKEQSKQEQAHVVESVESRNKTISITLLTGYNVMKPNGPELGIMLSKEIYGPLAVGVWGTNNGILGVSVGINF